MSLSVPIVARQQSIGALNLYAHSRGAMTPPDRDRARQFADQAAGAVALAVRLNEREEHARHLETALQSRSPIDQGIGIVMGRARISADQAFDVLRVRSQQRNLKLREVAAQIIAEVSGPPP
jgi:GAF domain-containing protein